MECTGNCAEVVFEGVVVNEATNTPITNQGISATLNKNGVCWFCTIYDIGSAKSDQNGRFHLVSYFDTALMKDHHIIVSANPPDNYITYPEQVGPGITPLTNKNISIEFYSLDPDKMKGLSFQFYRKTLLTLKLHRNTPIGPQKEIGLDFALDNTSFGTGLQERKTNIDTSLTIYTAADMYTKIKAWKMITPDSIWRKTDSVFCYSNKDNTISINY